MKDCIKISIIIPVYNVEQYMEKCIKSLRLQTLPEIEMIFIDDCSSDDSMGIVESYAEKDKRIIILRNDENIGPGPSRNRGIEAARGEYLSFVDPDDWVAEDYYAILYKEATENNADIVKGKVKAVGEDNREAQWWSCDKLIALYFKEKKPLYTAFRNEHFSAIFRRSFVAGDPELRYGNTKRGEDSIFLLKICLKEPSIALTEKAIFYHLVRIDSLEHTINYEMAVEGLKALDERIEILGKKGFSKEDIILLKDASAMYLKLYLKYDQIQPERKNKAEESQKFLELFQRIIAKTPDPNRILNGLIEFETLEQYPKKEEIFEEEAERHRFRLDELEKLAAAVETHQYGQMVQEDEIVAVYQCAAEEIRTHDASPIAKELLFSRLDACYAHLPPNIRKKIDDINKDLLVTVDIRDGDENKLAYLKEVFNDKTRNVEVLCLLYGRESEAFSIVRDYCEKDSRFHYIYRKG